MRQFPVLHSRHHECEVKFIPWEILEPHEKQAYVNHGQSLEQLAIRGGLSWREIYEVIMDKEFDYGSNRTEDYYRRVVLDAVEKLSQRNQANKKHVAAAIASGLKAKRETACSSVTRKNGK